MKKISFPDFIKVLCIVTIVNEFCEIVPVPYPFYIFLACSFIYFIWKLFRKEMTVSEFMKELSIVFVLMSVSNLITDPMVRLFNVSVQGAARVIINVVYLVFGIYGMRNHDSFGKERSLIKMSAAAFIVSVIGAVIDYMPLLTRIHMVHIGVNDSMYIVLAVLAAVCFFVARRNLADTAAD